ncbi:hypothetical protein GYMLUDRAFT_113276, partial [Collybiopsis luxurians FD-317 M1]
RISWCKARSRALRWQEDCILLQEEMRQVKEFLLSSQKEWELRAKQTLEPGHRAYAYRQADIREKM